MFPPPLRGRVREADTFKAVKQALRSRRISCAGLLLKGGGNIRDVVSLVKSIASPIGGVEFNCLGELLLPAVTIGE